ncbi:serine hydrolase domain-containing protein [Rathayibacter rathayi]|uniref:serine hydrolase domain-containing protein n=1 Tax=Rathayibacter rathayi TaxID=33887 RepID=UPI0015E33840|nr:serine hydrolase domain-containing protein [Rathayibacter rathayi]
MTRPANRLLSLVRDRTGAAQLLVLKDGETLIELDHHCDKRSLFWSFSASKPYIAILVYILAEQGLLGIDAPVASYWPEFAKNGKGGVTIRNVLQHRSGFASAAGTNRDALAMLSWRASIRQIERARLHWPTGTKPAYQILAFGFILGEVVQRVTGRPVRDVLRDELFEPLGARDTALGVTGEAYDRSVRIHAASARDALGAYALSWRAVRSAVVPSAGVSVTARDHALFYSMLLRGGVSSSGQRIVSFESIEDARTLSAHDEIDLFAKNPIAWANGFQLGGPSGNPLPPLGRLNNPRAFGHNGSNICVGWADPDRKVVAVYLTNVLAKDNQKHITDVSDAIVEISG